MRVHVESRRSGPGWEPPRSSDGVVAPCVLNPALFDLLRDNEDSVERTLRHYAAKKLCVHCPLKDTCLIEGRRDRADGIRGGVLLNNGRPIHHAVRVAA